MSSSNSAQKTSSTSSDASRSHPRESREAAGFLARALSAHAAGARARARDLARRAALAAESPESAVAAACALFALGDVDSALDVLDSCETPGDRTATDKPRRISYRIVFGRVYEALECYRRSPLTIAANLEAAEMLLERDDTRAIDHLQAAVDADPGSPAVRMTLAKGLGRLEQWDAAAEALRTAILLSSDEPSFLAEGADLALSIGAYADADVYARRLLARLPDAPAAHRVLGQLALFRGDAGAAAQHADTMIAAGDGVAGLTIRGAASTILGRDEDAQADLDAALEIDPDAFVARTWRAEVALRQGRAAAALADADRAMTTGAVAAAMVRELAEFAVCSPAARLFRSAGRRLYQPPADTGQWAEVWGAVDAIHRASTPAGADASQPVLATESALAAMRGNRTHGLSYLAGDATLRPLRFRPRPRAAARRLLDAVSVRPAADIFAGFDALIAEYRDTGLPLAHRAELHMWLGDYGAARSDFEAVIAAFPKTRWAYIGLATLETIGGEHSRALETLARGVQRMYNTTGPGVYGVRGEALRRLGRIDEAVADLETATTISPTRISAWLNLALAYQAQQRLDEALGVVSRIRRTAYPLFHDAARSLDTWLDDIAEPWPMLERSLELMLGNRASGQVTWRVGRSPIRVLWGSKSIEDEVSAGRAHEFKVVRARVTRTLGAGRNDA